MSDAPDSDLKDLAAVLGLTLSALVWHRTAGTLAPILRAHGLDQEMVERFAPPPAPRPIPVTTPKSCNVRARRPKPVPIRPEDLALEPLTPPIQRKDRPAPSSVWASFTVNGTAH